MKDQIRQAANHHDRQRNNQCLEEDLFHRVRDPATGKTARPDNPGKACDMGPDRDHIWTHYFVGANAVVTKLLGSEMHAKMAVERLQNAADLELIRSESYSKNELSRLKVKVINSGAGHYLPTGLTEVRQMWLYVKITDAEGKVLLQSGAVDEGGNIDEHAVLFNTVLGNAVNVASRLESTVSRPGQIVIG